MFKNWQLAKFEKRRRIEDANYTRATVLGDPFLLKSYQDVLELQLSLLEPLKYPRVVIELGSAGGITKLNHSFIVTTDIREGDGIDCLLNPNFSLPFEDSSLSGIIAKDVLHHISDPERHFEEIKRVLKNGGMAIYAEPNWNFVSKLIFTLMHPEPFDQEKVKWNFESHDPMYSNQALPYIIFVRDSDVFKKCFPELEVEVLEKTLNGLSFILSGGVMQRTFISPRILLALNKLEKKSKFLMDRFGTIRVIKITKVEI